MGHMSVDENLLELVKKIIIIIIIIIIYFNCKCFFFPVAVVLQ
jgi:hypothetical protein